MSPMNSIWKPSPALHAARFFQALRDILASKHGTSKQSDKLHIGIAVSGGVDSMALAHLCQEFKWRISTKGLNECRFTAFIVDHKSQAGSSLAVQRTKTRLESMKINSQILTLEWPEGNPPFILLNFETQARHLRYQALGRACMRSGISKLLLAHHSDDQAETVLMRLAAGHTGSGLKAMTQSLPIPECWGIHGVNESGAYDEAIQGLELQHPPQNIEKARPKAISISLSASLPVFESGGVKLLRPLLHFTKEELRQICEMESVEWEEDKSNHDISLTPRNTVRNLLRNDRLPRALQKDSLLHIAKRRESETYHAKEASLKLLENCNIVFFDARSSVLCIQIPSDIFPWHGVSENYKHSVGAYCIEALAQAVSPNQSLNMANMASAARVVFSDFKDRVPAAETEKDRPTSFTSCGIHFESVHAYQKHLESTLEQKRTKQNEPDPGSVWVLSRQPFDQILTPLIIPPAPIQSAERIDSAEPDLLLYSPSLPRQWSEWHLWDGRFWIRIRNNSSNMLVVRAWEKDELRAIRDSMLRSDFKRLYNTLEIAAPGKIRWTLPVIAEAAAQDLQIETNKPVVGESKVGTAIGNDVAQPSPEDHSPQASSPGKILVFPTLGTPGWLNIFDEQGNRKLEWEVRYKRISLRSRETRDKLSHGNPMSVRGWDDGGQGSKGLTMNDT